MSISDQIVVMKDGIFMQMGRPQEVYDDPASLFVAKFLGNPPINVFKGEVQKETLWLGDQPVLSVKGVPDQPVTVGIRPEGFILTENGPFAASLSRVEVMGRDVSVISAHPCSENPSVRSIITAETPVDRDARIRAFFLKAVQGVPVPQGDRSADPIFHLIKHRGTSLYETFRSKALAVPASSHPVSRLLYGISAHRRFRLFPGGGL